MASLRGFFALAAAFVWDCYSVLTRKISAYGYNTTQTTRRVFAYGLLWMIPALFLFEFHLDLPRFQESLGAVKTSVYIYMVPVITVVTARLAYHSDDLSYFDVILSEGSFDSRDNQSSM